MPGILPAYSLHLRMPIQRAALVESNGGNITFDDVSLSASSRSRCACICLRLPAAKRLCAALWLLPSLRFWPPPSLAEDEENSSSEEFWFSPASDLSLAFLRHGSFRCS